MYLLRLGFLDGPEGFHFCLLLAQYEHQISVKLAELKRKERIGMIDDAMSDDSDQSMLTNDGNTADDTQPEKPSASPHTGTQTHNGFGKVDPWPYSPGAYLARLFWKITWRTLWKCAWWRLPSLRASLLRLFGAKVGSIAIAGSAWVEIPWELRAGRGVAVGARAHLYNLGGLEIGDHAVISQDAYLCGGTHDYTDPTYPLIRKKIIIGRYVWIAAGAFIHPGVTVGEGAIVGARAVVTRDVEPWTIVAGNPARFIKARLLRQQPTASEAAAIEAQISA
jgi:putative colanic acid biosynthesis acetyltransferase WcaF